MKKLIVLMLVFSFLGAYFWVEPNVKYLNATAQMEKLSEDLELRISEWEKKEYKRPHLFGEPVTGNAAEFYKDAEEKYKPQEDEKIVDELIIFMHRPPETYSQAALNYLNSLKPVVELIKQGANTRTYKPLINCRTWFESGLHDIVTFQQISKYIVVYARELEKKNQFSEAIKLYCTLIRLGDDYGHSGPVISGLVGIAISAGGRMGINKLLLDNKLSAQNLNELLKYLAVLQGNIPNYSETRYREEIFVESHFDDLAKSSGLMPVEYDCIGWFDKTIWINRADCVEAWLDCIRIYSKIKRASFLPYSQFKEQDENIERAKKSLGNQLSSSLLGGGVSAYSTFVAVKAGRRGIYILTALKLYHSRHGKYPENLSELVPAIIPEVPLDPYNEKPFIYKIDNKGKLWLYSVGNNLKDDKGVGGDSSDIVISPDNNSLEPLED